MGTQSQIRKLISFSQKQTVEYMMSSVSHFEQTLDTEVILTEKRPSEASTTQSRSRLGAQGALSTAAQQDKILTPTYHRARHARKIQDWNFLANAPILFLGDSNVNRIPLATRVTFRLIAIRVRTCIISANYVKNHP